MRGSEGMMRATGFEGTREVREFGAMRETGRFEGEESELGLE